ncbi:MAG: integrin alpha [Planctomycetes bacterium]|nr:integrin alpha [Planctomycetota bacterium]
MKLTCILLTGGLCSSTALAQAGLFGMWGLPGDRLGAAASAIGDVDGDGRADFIVGSPQADGLEPDAGHVQVVSTRITGAVLLVQGQKTGDRFGEALAGIGDLTGDGVNEFVVGAPGADLGATIDCGAKYVVNGATGAILHTSVGAFSGLQFGAVIANVGDWSGDGKPEYAVGVPTDDTVATNAGAVYLFNGATHVLFKTLYGAHIGDGFGSAVAGAGRYTNDAIPDLIVGAPSYDSGAAPLNCGRAYVYSGASPYSLVYTYTGTYSVGSLGYSVSGGFDVNGDGLDEVLIGEPFADVNGNFSGRAVVLSGGLPFVLFDLGGGAISDTFGSAVIGLGDVDGDGKDDFAVGAPLAESGVLTDAGRVDVFSGATGNVLTQSYGGVVNQGYGQTLCAPGLINADPYADVIFGAPFDYWTAPYGGSLHIGLSNVPSPSEYCTAKITSQGCSPRIWLFGCPTLSVADNFHIQAIQCHPNKPGILIWSLQSASLPFGGGTLCVKPPIVRTPVQTSQPYNTGPCDGWYDFHMSHAYMSSQGLVAGTTFFAQYWMRDNGFSAPNNIGLSTAMQTLVLP